MTISPQSAASIGHLVTGTWAIGAVCAMAFFFDGQRIEE